MKHTGWGGTRLIGVGAVDTVDVGAQVSLGSFKDDAEKLVLSAQGQLEQAWGQLSQAAAAGVGNEQLLIRQASIQKIQDELVQLHEDALKSGSQGEQAAWRQRAAAVVNRATGELDTTVRLNRDALSGTSYRGLAWGFGVAAVVVVAGVIVWQQKKKRRRG